MIPRIPSGKESGVNPLWLPGGRLPNGINEAVVDLDNSQKNLWFSRKVDLK
jgi:hypothetical protein